MERRTFLKLSGAAAVCTCGLGLPGCKAMSGVSSTPVAPAESLNATGRELELDLAQVPALRAPGGACKLAVERAGGEPLRVIVLHTPDGALLAFEDRCTHGGRQLEYEPGRARLRCVSFGHSEFDLAGQVTKGPAQKPITRLATSLKGERLVIVL